MSAEYHVALQFAGQLRSSLRWKSSALFEAKKVVGYLTACYVGKNFWFHSRKAVLIHSVFSNRQVGVVELPTVIVNILVKVLASLSIEMSY